MISLLLLGCAQQAPWAVPTEPTPPTTPVELGTFETLQRFGPPTAMVGDPLIWSNGGALVRGDTMVDTPGFTVDLALRDEGLVVADGLGGLRLHDPETLAFVRMLDPGNARAVTQDQSLLREGWLLTPTERIALDGTNLAAIAGSAVADRNGSVWVDGVRHPIRGQGLTWNGDQLLIWTSAGALRTLDGTQLADNVTALSGPWYAVGSVVHALDGSVVRQRDARVVALDPPYVAWSDGVIERDGVSVATYEPTPVAPGPGPPPGSLLSVGPDGLMHPDWPEPVALPGGSVADRYYAFEGWSVAMSRNKGDLVAVHESGRIVRHRLPGMANDAVVVQDWLIVSVGRHGVAAIDLSGEAPVSFAELDPAVAWAGICTDGTTARVAWGEPGVFEFAVPGLERVAHHPTPGIAHSCSWSEDGWEVWDTTGVLLQE